MNYFASLDDSGDDEAAIPKKTTNQKKKQDKPAPSKAPIADASRPERRQRHDDRNTKGGRGGRPARDGKRQFDRRSGTGRGREGKKDGGGGRNWGSEKNDAKRGMDRNNYDKTAADDGVEKDVTQENEKAEVGGETKDEAEVTEKYVEEQKEEEVDNTVSYEDYMKQKKENPASELLAPIVSTKEITNEFAGVKVAVVKEEEAFTSGKSKAPRKKGSKKASSGDKITPSFRVGDKPGSGGGGGGRGGDRDRRDGNRGGRGGRGRDNRRDYGGRSGGRGGKKDSSSAAFSVTDDAFPSL